MTTNTEKRRARFEAWFTQSEQEELRKSCAKGWAEYIWNAALDSVCVELPATFNMHHRDYEEELIESLEHDGISYK